MKSFNSSTRGFVMSTFLQPALSGFISEFLHFAECLLTTWTRVVKFVVFSSESHVEVFLAISVWVLTARSSWYFTLQDWQQHLMVDWDFWKVTALGYLNCTSHIFTSQEARNWLIGRHSVCDFYIRLSPLSKKCWFNYNNDLLLDLVKSFLLG